MKLSWGRLVFGAIKMKGKINLWVNAKVVHRVLYRFAF